MFAIVNDALLPIMAVESRVVRRMGVHLPPGVHQTESPHVLWWTRLRAGLAGNAARVTFAGRAMYRRGAETETGASANTAGADRGCPRGSVSRSAPSGSAWTW
jgi:hypothetical protein